MKLEVIHEDIDQTNLLKSKQDNMEEKISGNNALDSFDDRNYPFEEYAKEFAEWEKINKRPYKQIVLRDQENNPRCTRYSSTHISNWQNINEYTANWMEYEQLDPAYIWSKWNKRKFIVSALDDAVKLWLIEWYTEIKKDKDMIKNIDKALSMWCYIATWSDDWLRWIYRTPYNYMHRKDWKIVWHAYPIVDKLADWRYVVPNSFGTDRWDKWYFYLQPSDLKWLFTLYAVIDKDDTWKFKRFKQQEKIKQFIKLWQDIYKNWDTKTRQQFIKRSISDFFDKEYQIKIPW